MQWTKEHKQFIGRVIFANFLKIPLWKYRNIIKVVEGELYSKKGNSIGVIVRELSKEVCSAVKTKKSSKAVAGIVHPVRNEISNGVKYKNAFGIRYVYKGFNRIYITSGLEHSALFYKLRRISSRNLFTHKILEDVVKYQRRYLETGDPVDLVPLSQVRLTEWINKCSYSVYRRPYTETKYDVRNTMYDISWTSRLVNRISVITPWGEERILRSFFQTQKDVNKRLIKKLFDKESEDLQSGKLKKPYTDDELKTRFKVFFPTNYELRTKNYSLSRHTIGTCRRQMGIPIASRRLVGYKYPPLSANFSLVYFLDRESIQNNVPAGSGIYELRLRHKEITYPAGRTNVIYLGSAKNLRKRIKEHLRANNKNGYIRDFVKGFDCCFRYILYQENWQGEERRLYELFVATYGKPPKCNRVKP